MPNSPNDEPEADALPVTGEVGGEGGSYADAITQAATENGDLPKNDRQKPDASPNRPGAVAGAVRPNPDSAEDGLRLPDAGPVEHSD